MRYWARIGVISSIALLALFLLTIFLNTSQKDLSNDEAALLLQSESSHPKPRLPSAPLGILVIIAVVSLVLLVSGFVIIALILHPSTSLVEESDLDGEPLVAYPFHV